MISFVAPIYTYFYFGNLSLILYLADAYNMNTCCPNPLSINNISLYSRIA